jgi:translation elongation factor EF-4
MNNANVGSVEEQLMNHFGFKKDEILKISAKNGQNVNDVLEAVCHRYFFG